MRIGVPTEIKNHEYRVGLVPGSVRELLLHGHEVLIQKGAGHGIEVSDQEYELVGAKIVETAEDVFAEADMIVKVKEPQPNECRMLREGQVIFTYLHLAAEPEITKLLMDSKCVAIAYETVTDSDGKLPLLAPMSEVAGRLATQAGIHYLEKAQGGRGILLGGVPGVSPADVVVLGGGSVGTEALRMAVGLGGRVTVLDKSLPRLRELQAQFGSELNVICANQEMLEQYVLNADLLVGAVLIKGAAAPKLVSRELVKRMRKHSVIVDVAIDQGGCIETSRPTTHSDPIYVEEDVIHYCVTNMPGAVPRTSAFALNNATLPFVIKLADKGYERALSDDKYFLDGLNVHHGLMTCKAVADSLGLDYVSPIK